MTRWMLFTALLTGVCMPVAAQDISKLGDFVQKPDSLVKEAYGPPHEVDSLKSKEAVVWTYFVSVPDRPQGSGGDNTLTTDSLPSDVSVLSLRPIEEEQTRAGYRQFAFWNDKVVAASLLRRASEAELLYEAGLSYLEKNANWVGSASGFENARLTRMGENLWTVVKQSDGKVSQAVLLVGYAGYLKCEKMRRSELRQLKAEFIRESQ